jgi:hypothetical protein
MSYKKTCLICGLAAPGIVCQPCFQGGRYSPEEMRTIRKHLAESTLAEWGKVYGDEESHYGDVAGYYQGYPLHTNFVSHGSSSGSVTLVRAGPCSHKWSPWKACGGRFDHRGPIETLYSRWCSLCREGEETRTADRL